MTQRTLAQARSHEETVDHVGASHVSDIVEGLVFLVEVMIQRTVALVSLVEVMIQRTVARAQMLRVTGDDDILYLVLFSCAVPSGASHLSAFVGVKLGALVHFAMYSKSCPKQYLTSNPLRK